MARSMFRTKSAHAGALVAMSLMALASTSAAGEANSGGASSDPITVKSDGTKTEDGAAPPPDVVRLHDGTTVRGKLVSSGGDLVSIKVASGETRSYFRSATTYVGAAADDPAEKKAPPPADAPAASAPAPTPSPGGANPAFVVHAATAHVNLVGAEPNLTFHMQTDSSGYAVLCTAPCSVDTWAGEHRFAVSRPDGKPIEAEHALALSGTETVRARLDDSSATRDWGILLTIVGGVVGIGAATVGDVAAESGTTSGQQVGVGLALGGLAILAVTLPIGISMIVNGGPHAQVDVVGHVASASTLRF